MKVLAAVDKFRGTATAAQVATAIGHACWQLGHDCIERPLADGGEGTLDALGGANRTTLVTGPLGKPVQAPWRLHRGTAVIEMACASGLMLAGGKQENDPIAATTTGTGELIDAALDLGAKRIIVCLGGSATTDGGLGAVKAIQTPARLKGVEFVVACDVTTKFTDAAKVFAPQKGASPAQVQFLTTRLEKLVQVYQQSYGVDVSEISGAGAAGGLAGGLAAGFSAGAAYHALCAAGGLGSRTQLTAPSALAGNAHGVCADDPRLAPGRRRQPACEVAGPQGVTNVTATGVRPRS